MTSLPVHPTGLAAQGSRAMNLAIDLGFAALLIICSIRYFSNHPWGSLGAVVLSLAVGSGLAYALASFSERTHAGGQRQRAGILISIALWLPLVALAPSYGWCAFALFVAVYRVLQGRAALVVSVLIVVAVSIGLFLMSNGQDWGLVLGPLFGGFVFSLAYRGLNTSLAEGRELITQLTDTREQLALAERNAGMLAERNRLASELHDTVVQRTASALLLLETEQQQGETSAVVTQAQETLRQSLAETRQIMHGLARRGVERESLVAALRGISEAYDAQFVEVGSVREIPEAVDHVLRRITQEALINATKHARASTRKVTLTFFHDEIGVDIADNGVGFTPDARADADDGYGLRAMAWRVESLGGQFSVESAPGVGTVVAGLIPAAPIELTEEKR